ncbi:MAG: non-heme iron oxygenase ferredoxin subunit [Alphaproteobacteria bacterium]|nr:non-heme iron oxygenase ferredoxin subunit [Alphaproteobacteria bacterium]
MSELEFIAVAGVDDVPVGKNKCFEVEGKPVLLCHVQQGEYRAVENVCSHEKKPLEGGRMRGGKKIVCPVHGAMFDLESGKALGAPAVKPIHVYPCKVEDGTVYIQLTEPEKPKIGSSPFGVPGVPGMGGL